jgi:hypothetical protein
MNNTFNASLAGTAAELPKCLTACHSGLAVYDRWQIKKRLKCFDSDSPLAGWPR